MHAGLCNEKHAASRSTRVRYTGHINKLTHTLVLFKLLLKSLLIPINNYFVQKKITPSFNMIFIKQNDELTVRDTARDVHTRSTFQDTSVSLKNI